MNTTYLCVFATSGCRTRGRHQFRQHIVMRDAWTPSVQKTHDVMRSHLLTAHRDVSHMDTTCQHAEMRHAWTPSDMTTISLVPVFGCCGLNCPNLSRRWLMMTTTDAVTSAQTMTTSVATTTITTMLFVVSPSSPLSSSSIALDVESLVCGDDAVTCTSSYA